MLISGGLINHADVLPNWLAELLMCDLFGSCSIVTAQGVLYSAVAPHMHYGVITMPAVMIVFCSIAMLLRAS